MLNIQFEKYEIEILKQYMRIDLTDRISDTTGTEIYNTLMKIYIKLLEANSEEC